MAFKLRSGNKPVFKQIGSSPVTQRGGGFTAGTVSADPLIPPHKKPHPSEGPLDPQSSYNSHLESKFLYNLWKKKKKKKKRRVRSSSKSKIDDAAGAATDASGYQKFKGHKLNKDGSLNRSTKAYKDEMAYLRNLHGSKTLDMVHVHAKRPSFGKRLRNILKRTLGYGGVGATATIKGYKNLADAEKTGESFWKKFLNPFDWGPSDAKKKSDISLDVFTDPVEKTDSSYVETAAPNLYEE